MIVKISSDIIKYEKRIQNLCKLPYYGHSKGCPNYGKKEGCPPKSLLINHLFDLDTELYVIYTEFAVGMFADRMKTAHANWAGQPREWYNPRRWQPKARKEHREEIDKFLSEHPEMRITRSPEANGVNVTKLMKEIDINLNWQWPPEHNLENKVYLVSLGGHLR